MSHRILDFCTGHSWMILRPPLLIIIKNLRRSLWARSDGAKFQALKFIKVGGGFLLSRSTITKPRYYMDIDVIQDHTSIDLEPTPNRPISSLMLRSAHCRVPEIPNGPRGRNAKLQPKRHRFKRERSTRSVSCGSGRVMFDFTVLEGKEESQNLRYLRCHHKSPCSPRSALRIRPPISPHF